MSRGQAFDDVDPFDLPGWLGTEEVTWVSGGGLRGAAQVPGVLHGRDPSERQACDLLAVDLAYPEPLAPDPIRIRAHQAWQHGQVLLVAQPEAEPEARPLLLAVPGCELSADLAIAAVARLALAVGADAARYAVHLQIGRERG